MSEWIWYPGEYELFHSILLHGRRQHRKADYPCFWLLPSIYPNVEFTKTVECERAGSFVFHVNGSGYILLDGIRYAENETVNYTAGKHALKILVLNARGLPAAFVEGDEIFTDGSWSANIPYTHINIPCGHMSAYSALEDNVEVFPFSYERHDYVDKKELDGGVLYDFGRETFGKLILNGVNAPVRVIYGESLEEATDESDAMLLEDVYEDRELVCRAFRYIFVKGELQPKELYMLYEYLPLERKAWFKADDPIVEKVFDTCAYTFHLNSREFFLDGIKRDRWVWSGDAYQSFMVNRCLFTDDDITKRTITALVGKPPYVQHINGINDYSFYQMIGAWEYWKTSDDTEFIKFIFPRLRELYRFCISRLDENGFVCYRDGDWVFIDWADLDKDGPMCAEQILLWRATQCMTELADICGESLKEAPNTDELKAKIFKYYYKADKGGFIDGFVSGKEMTNRQQNVLAVLYDLVDAQQADTIYERILNNSEIPPITTPYFEFFELLALCKLGHVEYAQKMIKSYWGGMLELGATSIWEQFDPRESGTQHYAMYGNKYGKSLCHAWGSGPIYILGRYIAGVEQTSASTFKIEPNAGIYKSFEATVPLRNGSVKVCYDGKNYKVITTADGGIFKADGKTAVLEKNKEYVF